MATVESWGTKKNGCRVGIRYSNTDWEYNSDRSAARIRSFDLRFSSDDPIYDTSNTLSCSGGAILDDSWSNAFSKSSSWSGTMTLKTKAGQYKDLSYTSKGTATVSVSLSGIGYAGGTLTDSVTVTYPLRPYSVPIAPTSLDGVLTGSTSYVLHAYWEASSYDVGRPVTSVTFRSSMDGSTWTDVATVDAGVGTVDNETYSYSATYTYTVSAATQVYFTAVGVNSGGTGPDGGNMVGPVWTVPPAIPVVTATRYSDDSISVSWSSSATPESGDYASSYQIYVEADGSGTWSWIGRVFDPTSSFTYLSGSSNHSYRFRVSAENVIGNTTSDPSNTVYNSVTSPTSLSASSATVSVSHGTSYDTTKNTSQTTVSWSHSAPSYVQNYTVFLNETLYGTTASGSVTSMVVSGLVAGSSNSIYVVANVPSMSASSATVTVSALSVLGPTSGVSLGSFSANGGTASVLATWNAVSGATGYYVTVETGSGVVTNYSGMPSRVIGLIPSSTPISVSVAVLNSVGYSAKTYSQTSVSPSVPYSPSSVDASYESGLLSATWVPPESNGGAALTKYQVKIEKQDTSGGEWTVGADWTDVSASSTSYSVAMPTVVSYRVYVRAVNGMGASVEAYAETGIIGGYIRIFDGTNWNDVFIRLNTSGTFSKSAIVRIFDGTNWVPLTYE